MVDDFEENMSKKILCSFVYDLEDMNQEISSQIDRDFEHIKGTILAGKITQAGQIFLHTAPHGEWTWKRNQGIRLAPTSL